MTANDSAQQITHCTRNAFKKKKKKKSTPQSAYVSIPQKLLFRNGFQNVHCIFLQPWGLISKNYVSWENMNWVPKQNWLYNCKIRILPQENKSTSASKPKQIMKLPTVSIKFETTNLTVLQLAENILSQEIHIYSALPGCQTTKMLSTIPRRESVEITLKPGDFQNYS